MNTRTLALLGPLTLFSAGCPSFMKATGPAFTELSAPKEKAVVYFFRPAYRYMADYPFFMSIPESANNCFKVDSGGYWAHVADPGPVTVAGALTPSNYVRLSLDLKPGDRRYVEIDIRNDVAVPSEVSAEVARTKIAATLQGEPCTKKVGQ